MYTNINQYTDFIITVDALAQKDVAAHARAKPSIVAAHGAHNKNLVARRFGFRGLASFMPTTTLVHKQRT
jgi:hypothetical protein